MKALVFVFRELAGLIIDDGSLALAILAVIALAWISSTLIPDMPLMTGTVLLFGCLGALVMNVAGAAQR
jgi:hypothetical protein